MTTVKTNTLEFDAQALREKILDLAMRGKLVPQDPNDEPASVLLEKIKAEKEQLIKDKKIKKSKPLAPIADDEKPFDIPDSWEWVRLGEVIDVRDGTHDTPKYVSKGIPLVTAKNFKKGKIDFSNIKYISNADAQKINERSKVNVNDILFAMIGTIGNPVLVKDNTEFAIKNVALLKKMNNLNMKFITYYILGSQTLLMKNASGGNQKFLSLKKINKLPLPLPPLEEENRIAAKIAQLLALLRKVESATQQYSKLQTLLKSKVLNLAMRGKLVEQDPHDEPASVLLEKIKAEKEQLVKEGKIKKSKPLSPIADDEKPFAIPDSWEWVRLGNIGTITAGGTPKTSEKSYWKNGNIPWITPAVMSNLQDEAVFNINSQLKYINNLGLEKSSAHLIPKNSLVVSSRAPIGYVNVVPFEYTTNQGCKSVSLYNCISIKFLYFAIKRSVPDMNERASGTTFKEISGTKFGQTIIPLPPLEEQNRIAKKIAELLILLK